MKKILAALLLCSCALLLSGCSSPNSLRLDLSRGYGENLKLIHINASSQEKADRIREFSAVLEDAQPLEKEFSLFAYYPDYLLEISRAGEEALSVVIDINGDYVDFYYPGPAPARDETLYRSKITAKEFAVLVHSA